MLGQQFLLKNNKEKKEGSRGQTEAGKVVSLFSLPAI